jgi:hypothetical protein
MPKKTKKEKLLAMYHKKLRLLEKKDVLTSSVQTRVKETTPTFSVSSKTKAVENEPVNQFFYSDLKKSILLIILILGIEVSLYFFKLIK